jgi:hypothetical protein
MLLPIALTVTLVGALAWASYAAPMMLRPRIAARRQTTINNREASREQVRRNPLDFVRAFYGGSAPTQLRLEQNVTNAQAAIDKAADHEQRLFTGFKGGVEPSHRRVVGIYIMFALWIISIVAHTVIELPIITSVSGGNVLFGLLGTMLALSIPVIVSLFLVDLHQRRQHDKIAQLRFSLAVTGVLTAFVIVIALLTSLAPIRAEIEYQDEIRAIDQQIAEFTEDKDENALLFAKRNREEAVAQQARSSEWNQALVPIAAAAEFATGFFLPAAIPLLQLRRVRRDKAKAEANLNEAHDALALDRAQGYQQLSRTFQDATVSQAELQSAVAAMAPLNIPSTADLQESSAAPNTLNDGTPAPRAPVNAPSVGTTEHGAPDNQPGPPPASRDTKPSKPRSSGQPVRRDPETPDDSFDLS